MWYLVAVTGPDAGRTFAFDRARIVLGRAGSLDCDLQLPTDATLGRRHATIGITGSGADVDLLPGRCGLVVDGRAVPRARIPWGAELAVASSRYRLEQGPPGAVLRDRGLPRRSLDEFEIGEEVGCGFSARVHAAIDRTTGTEVAVKIFRPELARHEKAVALFLREADVHARLTHENIVRSLCVGRERSRLFIGMEWIDGCDLAEYVEVYGVLDAATACRLGVEMTAALAFAHEQGIVHRDVKPNNVMVGLEGVLRARLVDFGMARFLVRPNGEETLTRTGEARGTPAFSPPECLQDAKSAGPAADVFGVGTTLYHALTRQPWLGGEPEDGRASGGFHDDAVVPLRARRPDLPPSLAEVVERAMRAKPEDRWPSARDMQSRLSAVAARLGEES